MNQETMEKTQVTIIKEKLSSYCISSYGQKRTTELKPSSHLETVRKRLNETAEAKAILLASLHMPFMGLTSIEHLTKQVEKGYILEPSELTEYADFLRSNRMIKNFMEKNQHLAPTLYRYSLGLEVFTGIELEIYQQIKNNQVDSDASRELRKIRRGIQELEKEIAERLNKFLKNSSHRNKIQEFLIVKKNERFTIPVKSSYKNQIPGTIVEESAKGTTVFIEPQAIAKLNEKLFDLKIQESSEVYQIQASLTGLVFEQMIDIQRNIEIVTEYDLIFAKGKFSRDIEGIEPKINREGRITFINVVHPLLGKKAVPLNLSLGKEYQALTITGPNAGGKTVVLKTLALTTLQVMLGVQIQADPGTEVALFDQIFVDIGDQQSIENALSTFSGHMKNISMIMATIKKNSLVLLDELGSGTEPNEGAALAIAIMEALYQKGATVVTTTHYGEIKRYSLQHPDFITAAMAFDPATLSPKYQLLMGETGESNALWIAQKMALSPDVLQQAEAYLQNREYDLEKRQIKTNKKVKATLTEDDQRQEQTFQKGDRIVYLETKQVGLVYEVNAIKSVVTIFIAGELIKVQLKRINLLATASELYPPGYELESLFTDYHERKFKRDIDRGSKKAHKILRKEMERRRENQE